MSKNLQIAIENLRDVLLEEEAWNCSAVTLFFNCEGYTIERRHQTPEALKRSSISMQNIKGDWIAGDSFNKRPSATGDDDAAT